MEFEVGQQVIWFYAARVNSGSVHKVRAQVVKLGSKRVQIKIQQRDRTFASRWVNKERLKFAQS